MSEIITFPLPTGANYVIPDIGDENWGQNVTNFLVAIPLGVMPTSGVFSLTGDVSFGPTFGLVGNYFKSSTLNPASTGFLRLAKTDSLNWRNNANSADLPLAINGSNQLTFNGTVLITGASGNLTDVGTDGITITGGTGAVLGSGTTISQHVADSTHNGYLSSADWSTFNGKGSGSVSSVAMTVPAFLSVSGSPITSTGTLAVSLSGTALPVDNGGTGATSFTAHAVIVAGGTGTSPLTGPSGGTGTTGQLLQSQGSGAAPIWATIATGSGTVSSGTANQFAYYAASTAVVSASGVDITNPTFAGALTLQGSSLQIALQPGGGSNKRINLDCTNPAADRIYTLPDRGANDTFAFLGGQAQTFSGASTFSSISGVTITPTSNQLTLGTTRTVTISATQPATTSRTYTMPDISADATFAYLQGTQTFSGAKTFSSTLTMSGATIAMGSNKITGLANGTTSGDAIAFGQSFTSGQITFSPTTTGIKGTTTNDNAAAGNVGEYIEATVSNQNYGTNNQWADITSISLTAGDWDVTLITNNYRNTSTQAQFTLTEIGISTTTGNSSTGLIVGSNQIDYSNGTTGIEEIGLTIAGYRQSLSATTTIYGKVFGSYSAGQPKIWARLSARRIR